MAKVDADKHRDLAGKYGVSGYPTIKFFPRGADKEAQDYNGGREVEDFVSFLNERAGTFRTADGGLTAEAGRVEELDELVDGGVTEETLAKAEAIVAGLDGADAKHGKLYVNAIKKILAKGTDYVAKETARLGKMIESGSVNEGKRTLFMLRRNVLAAFA